MCVNFTNVIPILFTIYNSKEFLCFIHIHFTGLLIVNLLFSATEEPLSYQVKISLNLLAIAEKSANNLGLDFLSLNC